MRNHWWHTEDCLNRVHELVNDGADWLLYGSSMGGYAALYFSRMFDKFAICLSPQGSVQLKNLEGETRWLNDFCQINTRFDEAEILKKPCCNESLVFYDFADKLDNIHRRFLEQNSEESSKLSFFDVPFSGHVPIRAMLASGHLQNLLERSLAGEELDLQALRMVCLRSFYSYPSGLARYTRDNVTSLSREDIENNILFIEERFNRINPELETSFLLAEICSFLGNKEKAIYYSSLTLNREVKEYVIIKHFRILQKNVNITIALGFLRNFKNAPVWNDYLARLLDDKS